MPSKMGERMESRSGSNQVRGGRRTQPGTRAWTTRAWTALTASGRPATSLFTGACGPRLCILRSSMHKTETDLAQQQIGVLYFAAQQAGHARCSRQSHRTVLWCAFKLPVPCARLITCGTVEEKIYRKQVFKGGLSRTGTEEGVQLRYFSQLAGAPVVEGVTCLAPFLHNRQDTKPDVDPRLHGSLAAV